MSNRGLHPISEIAMSRRALSMEIADALGEEFSYPEDFTYTVRYTVPEKDRAAMAAKIRARCAAADASEDAETFIALMDRHEWDVSFMVDGF